MTTTCQTPLFGAPPDWIRACGEPAVGSWRTQRRCREHMLDAERMKYIGVEKHIHWDMDPAQGPLFWLCVPIVLVGLTIQIAWAWLKTKMPHLRIMRFPQATTCWGCFIGWVGPNPATGDKRVFQIDIDLGPIHVGWTPRVGFWFEVWQWEVSTVPEPLHCKDCGWCLRWDAASLICPPCQEQRRKRGHPECDCHCHRELDVVLACGDCGYGEELRATDCK